MKKLAVSSLAVLMLGSTATVDAMSTKPSDIKRGVKSYSAVITKKIKYIDDVNHNQGYLPKGAKITIVEREDAFGNDLLYLKDRKVIALRDDSIKVLKPVVGKYDYTKYKLSDDTKQKLGQVSKSNPNYKEYYKAAVTFEKESYKRNHYFSNMNKVNNLIKPMLIQYGGVGPTFDSYSEWLNNGKPNYINKGYPFTCHTNLKGYKVDILSKTFINSYFGSNNRSVQGIKAGDLYTGTGKYYTHCDYLSLPNGTGYRMKDITFTSTDRYFPYAKIKEVYVTPMKKISYKSVIAKYGKPTSTKFYGNDKVEHHLIYNKNKKDGYQVIVALDNKYGNVKYLRKMND